MAAVAWSPAGADYPTGGVANAAAGGDQVYVTNSALEAEPRAANVARFGVDSGGSLSPAGTVPTGQGARGIVFTPELDAIGQRFAYVPAQQAGAIERYGVANNGALRSLGSTKAEQPFGIAIHSGGRMVYVTNFNDGSPTGTLSAYRVGAGGTLTLVQTVDSGAEHPKGVAVTSDGRFVYVTHGGQSAADTSVLTGFVLALDGTIGARVAEAPIGTSGHRVVITPGDRFAYVTNQEADGVADVHGFRIGTDGRLTPVASKPVEAGVRAEGAAISPDGSRLYTTALDAAAPVEDGQIYGFAIGSNGVLTEIERLDFGFDPVDLAFGLDGRNLYVADYFGHTVTTFRVGETGNLTPVQKISSEGPNPSFQGIAVQAARGPLTAR
jgi:DNA-binding beta-propeller fold protein YncE